MWMVLRVRRCRYPAWRRKSGVICDPHNLSKGEQERLCRGFVRQTAGLLGPVQDVPAPDVMTNGQHMLWMLDEYETISGGHYPGMITGKPVGMGDLSAVRQQPATAHFTLREALKGLHIDTKATTASLQVLATSGIRG